MASPQLEGGFLRLSNELAEALMRAPLNGSQLRITLAVLRECFGKNGGRKMAPLSLRKIAAATSLHLRSTRREINNLLRVGVLIRSGKANPLYGIGKDYEKWNFEACQEQSVRRSAQCATSRTGVCADQRTEVSANTRTHKKKEDIKKTPLPPSQAQGVGKKVSDPRHQPIRDEIQRLWEERNGMRCPWDGHAAAKLSRLLENNPSWTAGDFFGCVKNRFLSDENHADLPAGWLKFLPRYRAGPLDRYGKPKPQQAEPNAEEQPAWMRKSLELQRKRYQDKSLKP